jgi:hypothetical protein
MYEYKSIILDGDNDEMLNYTSRDQLNDEFKQGWEYVDNISQPISTGSTYTTYGIVLVILRKKKEGVTL